MKQIQLFTRSISIGILSITLGGLSGEIAQAQRPIPLLDSNCATTVGGGWGSTRRDLSIGRELYTAYMYINPMSGFSCRVPPDMTGTLRLQFGVQDGSDSAPIQLSVYLNGNEEARKILTAGKTGAINLDVSRAKSVALEVTCVRAYCSNPVWFYTAQFEPNAVSPGRW